ncbi:MAG: TrgA family protein [Pseudomonadota bacterium]
MPTAGKLIGAVLFAALAWYVSDLVKPLLPDGTPTGMLSPVNAFFGVIMGWRLMGRRAGEGFVSATGLGITTGIAIVFWALLFWGGYEMIQRAMRLLYDGPFEALQNMAILMLEYGQLAGTPMVVGTMFFGSLVAAWVTDFFAQRWP